ncbi:hypothetical protein WB67_06740 [bacteria symbiont BFo2 of Frankliniella occidentalis]|nr:hypothetical protein WB67_06740 [bacteria symbiont BFo2 of Frankliniella occidentalis]
MCGKAPKGNEVMKVLNVKALGLAINIPENFTKMPDLLADIKYPSLKNKPKFIYSIDDGAVSLGLTEKASSGLVDIDVVKDGMLELVKALKPKALSLTVDGNKAWLIVFKSQARDDNILNIQLFTMTNTKFVVGTFNMTDKYINQYCDVGVLSLLSLKETSR